MLVPLTGSMYVPGLLTQPEKVVVDIGTGYYVEKDSTAAQEYFTRKVKFVTENMERVQAIGNEKAKIRFVELLANFHHVETYLCVLRELVMDVMQEKLKGQFQDLEAGKGKQ